MLNKRCDTDNIRTLVIAIRMLGEIEAGRKEKKLYDVRILTKTI